MTFNHPFQVSAAIEDDKIEVTCARGFVNWREPKINGVAISGIDSSGKMRKGGPPILNGSLKYDKYNRCYICLKVKVDDDGTMPEDPSDDYLSIVISKGIRKGHDLGRQYWLHPIAVIAKSDPPILCQNVYFNLLHWVGVNTKDMFYSDPAPAGAAERYHHYFSSV